MTHPAEDTTGIAEAVHRESMRLRAEDEAKRYDVVTRTIDGFISLRADDIDDLARRILAALDGVS